MEEGIMPLQRTPPKDGTTPINFTFPQSEYKTPFIRRNSKRKNDGELPADIGLEELLSEIRNLKSLMMSSDRNIKSILDENKLLRVEVEALKKIVSNINATVPVASKSRLSSYADQVKSSGPVVLITPFDTNQNSDKTKEIIKDKINPIENQISGIRKAAKGAVVIECKDKKATELLKTSVVKNLGDGYKVELPKKRKPKFKICGMSDRLTDDQIIEFLIKQNEYLKTESELKVVKTIEVKDRFRNSKFQSIIEADPESYKKIMEVEKVYVNWDSCKVFDHVNVIRCYKCWGFNHYSKECTREIACKFCAEKHESASCSSLIHKCVNCSYYVQTMKMQLNVNHHAFSADCKVLERKYMEEKRKIDLSD